MKVVLKTALQSTKSIEGLGICVGGTPDFASKSADEQSYAEMLAVEEMIHFLNIEDKKLSKIHRSRRYNSTKTVPRNLLIHLENPINNDKVQKSAYCLKDFNKQVFVSHELSPVDA